jgi:hypothetical protein
MTKKVFSNCPVCSSNNLSISRLSCHDCEMRVDTVIPIPPFFRLPPDLQEFVMVFLHNRGNIREVEKTLGISYPTVCKKLDLVNGLLGNQKTVLNSDEILEQLEKGEISAKEAAELLKRR